MTLNRLTLIGFVGSDAQQKTGDNTSSYTVFSVATNMSWKNKTTGARETRTEWHRCIANGKLSAFAATLKKGAHVQVEGELRTREYDKDSVTHRVFECRVTSILKLDRASAQDESGDDPSA